MDKLILKDQSKPMLVRLVIGLIAALGVVGMFTPGEALARRGHHGGWHHGGHHHGPHRGWHHGGRRHGHWHRRGGWNHGGGWHRGGRRVVVVRGGRRVVVVQPYPVLYGARPVVVNGPPGVVMRPAARRFGPRCTVTRRVEFTPYGRRITTCRTCYAP